MERLYQKPPINEWKAALQQALDAEARQYMAERAPADRVAAFLLNESVLNSEFNGLPSRVLRTDVVDALDRVLQASLVVLNDG